jgi:hypothetical protein
VNNARLAGAWLLVALVTSMSVAACTSPNCDPNQADFFSGLGNAASGCYAAKDKAYQHQLDTSGVLREQERMRATSAAANARAANQNLADAQGRLAAVDQQSAIMEGQLSALQRRTDVSQSALRQAEREIEELRRLRSVARATPTPQALQAVETQERTTNQRMQDIQRRALDRTTGQ